MFRIHPFAQVERTETINLEVWQLVGEKIALKKITLNLNHVATHIRNLSEKANDPDVLSMRSFDSQILEIIRDRKFNDKDSRSFIASFICHSEAGLLSPLYYKKKLVYSGSIPKKNIQMSDAEPLKPFKDMLPVDFLGEVFAKVEDLPTVMKMNMVVKRGVTKFPDYYRYVVSLPVIVCKLAIKDYRNATSDKDKATFMFVIKRAISSGERVAKIIFNLFARRKLELPDDIVKVLMIERQFDDTMLNQLWYIGRFDIVETLCKDKVITNEKLVSLCSAPSAPDVKKLPVGYEKLVNNSTEIYKFEQSIDRIAFYTFLSSGGIYDFLLVENPYLFWTLLKRDWLLRNILSMNIIALSRNCLLILRRGYAHLSKRMLCPTFYSKGLLSPTSGMTGRSCQPLSSRPAWILETIQAFFLVCIRGLASLEGACY